MTNTTEQGAGVGLLLGGHPPQGGDVLGPWSSGARRRWRNLGDSADRAGHMGPRGSPGGRWGAERRGPQGCDKHSNRVGCAAAIWTQWPAHTPQAAAPPRLACRRPLSHLLEFLLRRSKQHEANGPPTAPVLPAAVLSPCPRRDGQTQTWVPHLQVGEADPPQRKKGGWSQLTLRCVPPRRPCPEAPGSAVLCRPQPSWPPSPTQKSPRSACPLICLPSLCAVSTALSGFAPISPAFFLPGTLCTACSLSPLRSGALPGSAPLSISPAPAPPSLLRSFSCRHAEPRVAVVALAPRSSPQSPCQPLPFSTEPPGHSLCFLPPAPSHPPDLDCQSHGSPQATSRDISGSCLPLSPSLPAASAGLPRPSRLRFVASVILPRPVLTPLSPSSPQGQCDDSSPDYRWR